MRIVHRITTVLVALAIMFVGTSTIAEAQFSPTGSFGSLPQATFGGTGIPNHSVERGGVQGVTLGLSAAERYSSPVVTNNGAGTFYATPGFSAPNRAMWNFNYFVGGASVSDYFYTLYVDNNPGANTSSFLQYNINQPSGTVQGSWNIGFNFIGGNPAASGEYTYALAQFADAGRTQLLDQVAIQVDVGVTATPEPASVALLATGLLGVVGFSRRRRMHKV